MIKFVFKKQIEKEEVNEKKYIDKNCIYSSEFMCIRSVNLSCIFYWVIVKKKLRKRSKSYFI